MKIILKQIIYESHEVNELNFEKTYEKARQLAVKRTEKRVNEKEVISCKTEIDRIKE